MRSEAIAMVKNSIEAIDELTGFIKAVLNDEDYQTAGIWLESAKSKLESADGELNTLLHHQFRSEGY
jgi:hypothetical protein